MNSIYQLAILSALCFSLAGIAFVLFCVFDRKGDGNSSELCIGSAHNRKVIEEERHKRRAEMKKIFIYFPLAGCLLFVLRLLCVAFDK